MNKTRMKKIARETGITLVALVITIIILLILAGISISALTNQGLFTQAQNAKNLTEEKTAEENAILENYLAQINKITGGSQTEGERLASKVKVGDYVSYTPDIANTTNILSELSTYSGNTDSTLNTTDTLTQETSLKWRVLDIENGKVRLISEVPTTSTVTLEGYNGYNNAVYLLDKTCKTLYNKVGYAENVQNLKIEDIKKYMTTTDYSTIDSNYGQTFSPSNKYYPSILMQEKDQTIITNDGTTQPEARLDLSEQTTTINQTEEKQAASLTLKYKYWYKNMADDDFTNLIYYDLLTNHPDYWISSRTVYSDDSVASFGVRIMGCGYTSYVASKDLYYSNYYSNVNLEKRGSNALRPVITLNSNVLVKSGNGTTETPYEIGI